MGTIRFIHRGHLKATMNFLGKAKGRKYLDILNKYGRKGVEALSLATPKRSGKTSESWNYEIFHTRGGAEICWTNSNVNKGENIAILIQFGHGTRNGGYVKGYDYINPALRPVFDEIANAAWKEVTGA